MFQLTDDEKVKVVTICDRFNYLKYSSFPQLFTNII